MSRPLSRAAHGLGSLAVFRFLAVGTEVRSMDERRAHETVGARNEQPERPASLATAEPGQDAEREDAVAGSEFVDDRIRLRE